MAAFLISGLLNMETVCRVRGFPINYYPVDYPFFGVATAASGVALNIAKALTVLENRVILCSLLADDVPGRVIIDELKSSGIDTENISMGLRETPNSVVLYDESSRRQIYCDLKDIQECMYDFASGVLRNADAVLAGNINFSRPLLKLAKEQHKLVATDVHVLSNPDDDYNREFLESADIVFLSDEGISGDYQQFLSAIGARFSCRLIVLGMGSKGAMMYLKDENRFVYRPAYSIGSIVSTVGAGDALFSSFMHYYVNGMKPEDALDRAQLFAAMKIRSASASKGFPTGNELEEMFSRLHS